jgi:hypothetical protein
MALQPIYNIEIYKVNTPHQRQQTKQDKQMKRDWFNIFKFLMISVMREIWLEAWLTRYGLRVWMASSMIGKE